MVNVSSQQAAKPTNINMKETVLLDVLLEHQLKDQHVNDHVLKETIILEKYVS